MKCPNKRELRQIASFSFSDFKDFMKFYKEYAKEPYSFLVIDIIHCNSKRTYYKITISEKIETIAKSSKTKLNTI